MADPVSSSSITTAHGIAAPQSGDPFPSTSAPGLASRTPLGALADSINLPPVGALPVSVASGSNSSRVTFDSGSAGLTPAVPAAPVLTTRGLENLFSLSPQEQFLQGERNLNGEGCTKDLQKARELIGLSAAQGYQPAISWLEKHAKSEPGVQ